MNFIKKSIKIKELIKCDNYAHIVPSTKSHVAAGSRIVFNKLIHSVGGYNSTNASPE